MTHCLGEKSENSYPNSVLFYFEIYILVINLSFSFLFTKKKETIIGPLKVH